MVLVRHVLSALPSYVFSSLQVPKTIIKSMETRMCSFLWGGSSLEPIIKINWRSWERLALPACENGLGVKRLEDVMDSFSCKLWWKLKNGTGLWANFVLSCRNGVRDSCAWPRVRRIQQMMEAGTSSNCTFCDQYLTEK